MFFLAIDFLKICFQKSQVQAVFADKKPMGWGESGVKEEGEEMLSCHEDGVDKIYC